MNNDSGARRLSVQRAFAVFCGLAVFGLLFPGATPPALGEHRGGRGSVRHSRRYDDFRRNTFRYDIEYRNRDAVRLQENRISAEAEARREEGRRARRLEVQEDTSARKEAFLSSQEAIRSASWAAERAPRGAYYRLPGFRTASLPPSREEIEVGGRSFSFHEGVFFRKDTDGFVAVTAPRGARVSRLPASHLRVSHDSADYYYYFGTFFSGREGAYVVVAPPPGIVVPYLPDGYSADHREGILHYVFGGVAYRPYYDQGVLVFSVTDS